VPRGVPRGLVLQALLVDRSLPSALRHQIRAVVVLLIQLGVQLE